MSHYGSTFDLSPWETFFHVGSSSSCKYNVNTIGVLNFPFILLAEVRRFMHFYASHTARFQVSEVPKMIW